MRFVGRIRREREILLVEEKMRVGLDGRVLLRVRRSHEEALRVGRRRREHRFV